MLIVLFFALLLTTAVATFTRRSIIDAMVARNRDATAQAEALARGGVRLGIALLQQDKIAKAQNDVQVDSLHDAWALIESVEIPVAQGTSLRISIEDSGSLFNLNSLFDFAEGEGDAFTETIPFLEEFFDKVIGEMALPPAETERYNVTDLSEALIDWVDADSDRLGGGSEDDHYLDQVPPYRAQNGPLRSVDDLMLVEGFDRKLVEAIRPYVTVFPYAPALGINPNSAPPHVLSLLFFADGGVSGITDFRLAKEDEVKRILAIREAGGLLCKTDGPRCTSIGSVLPGEVVPELRYTSPTFKITAHGSVGATTRTVIAVVDRDREPPLLLSWKVR